MLEPAPAGGAPAAAAGAEGATKSVPAPQCHNLITEPVVFVTRVEYANLFHTSTGTRARGGGSALL